MRYPSRLLTEDEEVLHQFRPHWKVLLPALGWAMLVAALVGIAIAALDDRRWWGAAIGVAVVVWLLLSGRAVLTWYFTNYVLTTERIIVRGGMIARTGTEIPLENINNVLFSQSVIERLLGYGDVLVESAGSAGQSRLMDIPDPEAFQSEIYRAREQRTLHFKREAYRLAGHGGDGDSGQDGASGRGRSGPRDVVAQLEALADLRERGHLTDAEFAAKKASLLRQADVVPDAAWDERFATGEAALDEAYLDDRYRDGPYAADRYHDPDLDGPHGDDPFLDEAYLDEASLDDPGLDEGWGEGSSSGPDRRR